MKNFIVLVALLSCAQGASAITLDSMSALVGIELQNSSIPSINVADSNEMRGDSGVQMFDDTMKQSPLNALLLALDTEAPLVAKNAKYVVMVNETHQTQLMLTQLLAATQNNNQLMEQLLIKQGNQYG